MMMMIVDYKQTNKQTKGNNRFYKRRDKPYRPPVGIISVIIKRFDSCRLMSVNVRSGFVSELKREEIPLGQCPRKGRRRVCERESYSRVERLFWLSP